ncbi:cucumber peeling cupredoxin-like [Musa acuminata AAA Group]|uniref:cucumber peeling cupredoxin-like n=1 Tax=Musa acuminata AAA Group TaxID=214697 RepID=UPI0031DB7185
MAEAHRTLLLLVAAMSCLVTVSQAHQKIHIVGGSYGWKIPPNKTFYEEWANKQSFFVGDKLVFLYTTGLQNVIEASEEEEFVYCKQTNVEDVQFVGPTILELTKAGVHYFYCSVGLHCEGGQKLRINVTDEATT